MGLTHPGKKFSMPRRDAATFLSEAQAVTAQAVSTNSLKKGYAKAPINTAAKPLFLHSIVTTTLTDGGSNTSTDVDVVDSTAANLGSNLVVVKAAVLSFAQAAAAGTHKVAMFPVDASAQIYWGVRYTPNGANLTGGAFTTWVSNQRELQNNAPPAFTV